MRLIAALVGLAFLAGCGADGAPVRPTASAGVSVGTNGISTGARVGLRKGPLGISLGV